MFKKLLFTFILSFLLTGCDQESNDGNDGDSSFVISEQTLTGTINGKSFTFVSGSFEEDSFDPTKISVTLYNVTLADVCNPGISTGKVKVFFSIPESVGEINLSWGESNSQTVTMYDSDGNQNIIATEGKINIISISNTTLEGGLVTASFEGSQVNGKFTLTRCE